MGNSDHFLLTLDPGEEAVTEEQLEFHRSFRPTVRLELGSGETLLAFHGSPRSRDEILGPWMEEEAFREPLEDHDARIFAGGHVHLQWSRRCGPAYFVNPGSVGLAYDHRQPEDRFHCDPWAEYAIVALEDSAVQVEFRHVPFDAGAVVRAIEASGMPHPDRALRLWDQSGRPT